LRLLKLIKGGNQYAAALTSLAETTGRVIIRETHQDPSQAGRPSFPATGSEVIRPYTKKSLLKHGAEEVEETAEETGEGGEEWERETEAQEGDVRLDDYQKATEADDDEYEE
jgi:hypothetical protein